MKKLKRVVIENFQCHKKTVIEPSLEGLTVITGPTDHGKSGIVRAMKWLLYNRPLGTDFIRHGQTECKVTFEFADGTIVQRRRTTSLNQYYVNGQLYEGFGNGVPLEVQQATGVYIYEVADQTLNLNVSEQLAGPFLGNSISAPLRARILGKLAGTEDIDRAHKKLGTDIYHAKQNKKRLEDEELPKLDEKIAEYSWVEPLGQRLKQVQMIYDQLKADNERLEQLRNKKNQYDNVNAAIYIQKKKLKKYYDIIPDVFKLISSIEPDIRMVVNLMKRQTDLSILSDQINQQVIVIKNAGRPGKALEQINETNLYINKLEKKKQQLQRIIKLHKQAMEINIKIDQNRSVIKSTGQPIKALEVLNKCTNYLNKLSTINKTNIEYKTLDRQIGLQSSIYKRYQRINEVRNIIKNLEEKVSRLTSLQKRKLDYEERKKQLVYYTTEIDVQQYSLTRYQELSDQAKENYKKLLKEAGICPFCGSEIKDDCLEHVI